MRTEYHTLQPIFLSRQAMQLQVGDQLLTDGAMGTIAQYRGGRLLAVSMISRLGLVALVGAGMIARA